MPGGGCPAEVVTAAKPGGLSLVPERTCAHPLHSRRAGRDALRRPPRDGAAQGEWSTLGKRRESPKSIHTKIRGENTLIEKRQRSHILEDMTTLKVDVRASYSVGSS